MTGSGTLRVVILKPSKYAADGYVERFRWGFMPNSTVPYLASMTPARLGNVRCEIHRVDEYVQTDLDYLHLLGPEPDIRVLLALVGVQSHQLHRALDLAAAAVSRGCAAVIGGPHPMTCDTRILQGRGVSFALCEAELVWTEILADAAAGDLKPVYGGGTRWQKRLSAPVIVPPSRRDLARYVVRLLGVYPARGCPYSCNFCSVIRIAGHAVRSQPVETTMATLVRAQAAGVRFLMFTSDNFNKYPEVQTLLESMIEERIRLPFFVQCDAQIYRQPELVRLLARAGCFQMFVGAESFDSRTLQSAHKFHNTPAKYAEIVRLCRENGISSHFSNILGFPSDTEESIREHLETLRRLAPDVASFYLLTPVPGTEQYEEFRRAGLLTEDNLDRYDGSSMTWRHPTLPAARLTRWLFDCYRTFFGAPDVSRKLLRLLRGQRDFRLYGSFSAVLGYSLQSRWSARCRLHPMAGGIQRRRLDRDSDFRSLRRQVFGIDRAPLPDSLPLSAADEETNRRAKLVV
ncbi:MAG TPA: radical SAM protein [Thermoanaerobaculia bacterium]